MASYQYQTRGTCSRAIGFEVDEEGKLHNVQFMGGCPGNLAGIGRLVEGADALDIANKLQGTTCGGKPTSCPDQLAHAIKEALGE